MSGEKALIILIVGLYLFFTLLISYYASRKMQLSLTDLFVASRSLGLLALVMAVFGSLITAFGMLGVPGEAYKIGYSAMGYMVGLGALGSVLGFYLIGYRAWLLASTFNYITPVEFLEDRWDSYPVRFIVACFQIFYEVPYLLICGIGAGSILTTITGGYIPYWLGALIVLLITVYSAYSGGMRGTAWTNIFQGTVMFAVLALLMGIVYRALGGGAAITANLPGAMLSLGGKGQQSLGTWIPYSLLATGLSNGIICHLLIRNMSADSPQTLQRNTIIFPILYGVFFFMAVSLGVWGRTAFPGLSALETDSIIPLLVEKFAPLWMIGLLGAGVLSAIMSSWDGMILAASSIFSDDIVKPMLKRRNVTLTKEGERRLSRYFILALSAVVYILVLVRPDTILAIATFAFSGFAALVPAYFAALYWKRATDWGAIVSVIVPAVFIVLWAFNILPAQTTFGMHYVAPGFILAAVLVVAVSLLTRPASRETTDKFFRVFDEVYADGRQAVTGGKGTSRRG